MIAIVTYYTEVRAMLALVVPDTVWNSYFFLGDNFFQAALALPSNCMAGDCFLKTVL